MLFRDPWRDGRRSYALDELPHWIAEQCAALPRLMSLPEQAALTPTEQRNYRTSRITSVISPLVDPGPKEHRALVDFPATHPQISKHNILLSDNGDAAKLLLDQGRLDEFVLKVELNANRSRVAKDDDIVPFALRKTWLLNRRAFDALMSDEHDGIIQQHVDANTKNGTPLWLCLVSVNTQADSLDIERSSLLWHRAEADNRFICDLGAGGSAYFDKARLGDAKFFWDASIPSKYFVSQAVVQRFTDVGISGFWFE